ncbi:hypothetical protein [Thalassotalea euphylliae]|uniref:Uncharacterized protein n=1 Tax=Thalassotalea euphylliae TaxID=1655234 RepID=A0A3E0U4E8_9GAMM|nr:hypothetical protein [Thalassotalea euphylliae]REL31065.1 hypothetical protein DXX94_10260 [Thalassotalea euphylliae]
MTESELMKTEQIQSDEYNSVDYPGYVEPIKTDSFESAVNETAKRNEAHQKTLDKALSAEQAKPYLDGIRNMLSTQKISTTSQNRERIVNRANQLDQTRQSLQRLIDAAAHAKQVTGVA